MSIDLSNVRLIGKSNYTSYISLSLTKRDSNLGKVVGARYVGLGQSDVSAGVENNKRILKPLTFESCFD